MIFHPFQQEALPSGLLPPTPMRKYHLFRFCILATLVALFTLNKSYSALADDLFEIGKTPWGITRAQTAKAINIKLPPSIPPDGGMSVKGFDLGGFDGQMGYVFLNDKLVEINFSLDAANQPKFTQKVATDLKLRLERQFTRTYGKPEINNQQCDNVQNCLFSLWHKNPETAVGLFFTDSPEKRNLGISYMNRKDPTADSPFEQPHKGLVIVPSHGNLPQGNFSSDEFSSGGLPPDIFSRKDLPQSPLRK